LVLLGELFVVCFLVSSCGDVCPDWSQALKNQPPATAGSPAPSSVKTTNDLIVYLDNSGSMAGYLSRDGQTIFGKTLRELRYATGTFSGGSNVRVLVRRVGADVGPPLPDMDLTTASQDPSVFRSGETNLAGAISSFKIGSLAQLQARPKPTEQGDGSNDRTETQELSPPARFHVLVTDGVQSTRKDNSVQDCSSGSDQFCIRQKIGELLQAGWGGCVLGIKADFHGKVYSEVSGAAIPYETKSNDPSSYRPFYLYIFSPDPAALDSLIKSLKERLRPLVTGADSIRELNLSFPYANGFAEFDSTVPKESRDVIQRIKDRGGPPARFTFRISVNTERSGPKPLAMQVKIPWSAHALDTGNSDELAKLVSWNLVPIYPANDVKGQRFPEIKIVSSQAEGDRISLQATVGFPPGTEEPSCRVYRLEGRLNLNQATPQWIRSWSTDLDTTREVGNRTFFLETALLGLWNNSSAKELVVAEAYLRVGPSD
jgi:hypothetical protein